MNWLECPFRGPEFKPHGFCYSWNLSTIWLDAAADISLALAYYIVPATLVYFLRPRKDQALHWLIPGFLLFVCAHAIAHTAELWTFWHPASWLTGSIEAATAAGSIGMALALSRRLAGVLVSHRPDDFIKAGPTLLELKPGLSEPNLASGYRTAEWTRVAANTLLPERIDECNVSGEKLRESDLQLGTAIAEAPIPTIIYDERGKVRLLSQGWTDYSGYTIEDIPTLSEWTVRAYGKDSEAARRFIDKLFAITHAVKDGVWIFRAKDGTERTWEFCTTPLGRDSSGVRVLLSQAVDLTHVQAAEAAVRQANEELRQKVAVLELAPILVCDKDNRIVLWTVGAQRLYGFSQAEALNRQTHELFQTQFPESRASVDEALRREGKWQGELVRSTRNGDRRVISCLKIAYGGSGSEPVRIFEVDADVTARERAEAQKLHDHETRFRSMIEHASDLITVLNSDGIVRFQSPSLERILGYPPAQLEGTSALDLIHPDDLAKTRDTFKRALKGTVEAVSFEYRCRHRDGSWRVLQSKGRMLPAAGGEMLVVLNSRDVTEQKSLEGKLRQAQKMEAVGQLAGGIAHDFNNLLSVIAGHSELLEMRLRGNPETSESIAEIRHAAERATALTRQLLAFSRQQVAAPRVLNLNAAVGAAEKMLRRLIGEDVELTTKLQPKLKSVWADPGQIDQVLVNLAVNARDAMPTGGHLRIETREVKLESTQLTARPERRPGRYVLLSVSDTGCGMTREVMARIFEPFFTTKAAGEGTGLGLAVTQRIVEQCEGFCEVESAPGVGATFKIYLPAVKGSAAETPAQPDEAPHGHGETILLVEDEQTVSAVTLRMLEHLGYRVLVAASAEEALRRMKTADAKNFELLLTDVIMPAMSGRQLADAVLSEKPGVRVLFQSGHTDEVIIRHGVLHAEVAFLQKPFTLSTLARKVREVLDQRGTVA